MDEQALTQIATEITVSLNGQRKLHKRDRIGPVLEGGLGPAEARKRGALMKQEGWMKKV